MPERLEEVRSGPSGEELQPETARAPAPAGKDKDKKKEKKKEKQRYGWPLAHNCSHTAALHHAEIRQQRQSGVHRGKKKYMQNI